MKVTLTDGKVLEGKVVAEALVVIILKTAKRFYYLINKDEIDYEKSDFKPRRQPQS